jgi:diacylglycerol kinase (ATP)
MFAPHQLPRDARDVLVGVNPRAGASSQLEVVEEFVRRLSRLELRPEVVEDPDRLAEIAATRAAAGYLRAVVAAGGDGTVRLLAERTMPGTPLFVLPLGTANLLAGYLGITSDPVRSARLIAEGWTLRQDAGQANGRLFTLMAGCGFDADVVRRLHAEREGNIHQLSYAKPILDSIRKYDYPELRVYWADAEASGEGELTNEIRARWAFVINVPRYAGGLRFAPDASGSDGLLDVCTFKEGSLWHGVVYLGGVMLGQHQAMQDFSRVQTRRVRIEADGPVPFQLDGDPGGELPVEIRVLPGRLTLIVDREWAEREGMFTTDDGKGSVDSQ